MTIKAVLFDADGVIILPKHFADYLEQELNVTRDVTHEFFGGRFRDCLLGRADLKETIEPFLPRWGWQGTVQAFLQRWFETENAVDPRVLDVVTQLRKLGIICGLATNQERYRVEYMKMEMGFANAFDAIFSSAELGAMKHEPLFYVLVTDRLCLRPKEILFWDDAWNNVEAARDFGWNAESYSDFVSFQKTLRCYVNMGSDRDGGGGTADLRA